MANNIEVFWDVQDPTILRWAYHDPWTWADFYDALHRTRVLSAPLKPQRIDLICDLNDTRGLPSNIIFDMHSATLRMEDNWGIAVTIGANPFVATMIQSGRIISDRIARLIFLADSEAEARQIIYRQRSVGSVHS